MHTLRWDDTNQHWVVEFVTETRQTQLGFFENGAHAAELVNSLNGGQLATVSHERGKLSLTPSPSDAELLKQLQAEEAKAQ